MKTLEKMTRNQQLKQPEYYMEKLQISFDEAVELMDFDKGKGSVKAYVNEESKQRVEAKKVAKQSQEDFKTKARAIARKLVLEKDLNVQFDNGSVRMDVEKELQKKVPHQSITAEFNAMVKENLLKKEKVGTKTMYQRI